MNNTVYKFILILSRDHVRLKFHLLTHKDFIELSLNILRVDN